MRTIESSEAEAFAESLQFIQSACGCSREDCKIELAGSLTQPDKIKLKSNAKVNERAARGGRGKEISESDVKRILHSYLPGHSIPGESEAIIGRHIHQMREL